MCPIAASRRLALATIVAACAAAAPVRAQDGAQAATQPGVVEARELLAQFRGMTDAELAQGVQRAIAEGRAGALLGESLLGSGGTEDADARVARMLVAAISDHPPAGGWGGDMVPVLARAAQRAELHAQAARALGQIRTPESARALIAMLDADAAGGGTPACWSALVELSGRRDIPAQAQAWNAWLEGALAQGPSGFERAVIEGLAGALERERQSTQQLRTRTVDAMRRLHVAVPREQRSSLLVELLGDGLPSLRKLGLELVARELSEATQPGPDVERAITLELQDPDPAVRARTATILGQIGTRESVDAVLDRLRVEDAPTAAAAMLRAASRAPDASAIGPAVSWISRGAEARSASAELILSLSRAGLLDGRMGEVAPALAVLRATPPADMTGAEMRCTLAIGDESDAASLVGLLRSSSGRTRLLVAQVLAERGDTLHAVVNVGESDAELFEIAVRGIITLDATPKGYRAVERLATTDDGARTLALRRISERLTPADRIALALERADDPGAVEMLLGSIETLEATNVTRERDARAMEVLAMTRLRTGRPGDARIALDAFHRRDVARAPGEPEPRLERLVQAIAIADGEDPEDVPAEVWVEAAELCGQGGWAEAIAGRAITRFGQELPETLRARLRVIAPKSSLALASNDQEQPAESAAAPITPDPIEDPGETPSGPG
ncbi:MAG: hypothetical protein RBS39_08390 [Phycisphaerales bacterium]|jgi:hypothetical protein|nr:hypothetical protein [Phycisphaerales bacterium]